MAAARTKRAGKVVERRARAMVTVPGPQRLAEHLQAAAGEFRQLVEERHAVSHTSLADGVVRSAEPPRQQQLVGRQPARCCADTCGFRVLHRGQRR
jgi:hypothetical protein